MRASIVVFVSLLHLVLLHSPIQGQIGVGFGQDGAKLTGFGDVKLDELVEFWESKQREEINTKMDLLAEQITRVCELTEPEQQKLRVAIKGVIKKRLTIGTEQLTEFAYTSNLVTKPAGWVPSEEEYEKADKLHFYAAGLAPNGLPDLGSYFGAPLQEHPLWQKTLERTLPEEKFEKFREYRISRNSYRLKTAIAAWIASLDAEIFLTDQQIENITNKLTEDLQPEVSLVFPVTARQAELLVDRRFGKSHDSLGDLITEDQTARRKVMMRPNRASSRVGWGNPPDR